MKLWLFSLWMGISLVGCTSTEVSDGRKDAWDNRLTGAQTAAHCMNGLVEKSAMNASNWKRSFIKQCGKDSAKYIGNSQFEGSLSLEAHNLLSPTLAE